MTEVDEEAARLQRIVELSAAFEPASIAGLTRRYWDIAGEIRELERERANLGVILTEHIEATGEVIQVDGLPALRLVGTYRWIGTTAVEERRLRFDRKGSST